MIIIDRINGFRLCKDPKGRDLYQVIWPSGATMVETSGSRDEVLSTLRRWREEIDFDNPFMLDIENSFINRLEAGA
jgi:hypothetical protein